LDASTQLLDPDYTEAIDALIAGEIDVVIVPQQDLNRVQHTLGRTCSMQLGMSALGQ
jgi:hypothetical protein